MSKEVIDFLSTATLSFNLCEKKNQGQFLYSSTVLTFEIYTPLTMKQ
jgi:hypothetical protein